MRDPQMLFERVAGDLATVDWPAPAEIRSRARRRTIRTTTILCAPFVVLVAAISLLVANSRPAPTPFGQPPTPTPQLMLAIPPEAMLQADDMGVSVDSQETFQDDNSLMPLDPNLDWCMSVKHLVLPKTAGFLRAQQMLLHRASEADRKSSDFILDQYVGRFAADPERFVNELRRVAATCDGFVSRGPIERDGRTVQTEVRHRWALLDEDIAGDQSLVLRHEGRVYDSATGKALDGPTSRLFGVVRVGDLVAIVQPKDMDPERLRQLLQRAAARLCVAANPRC